MKIFILVIKDHSKPVKSVSGEYLAFDSRTNAQRQIKEWKALGNRHVYGRDTFDVKDIKIRQVV